jgi:hypothetical protein
MPTDEKQAERARAIGRQPEATASLKDDELERELTIAAAGYGDERFNRFVSLLLEKHRRLARAQPA